MDTTSPLHIHWVSNYSGHQRNFKEKYEIEHTDLEAFGKKHKNILIKDMPVLTGEERILKRVCGLSCFPVPLVHEHV